MKDRLVKLLSVKSIVTLILTIVFAYLCIIGVISGQDFLTVFMVIIAFYFSSQAEKRATTTADAKEVQAHE